MGMIERHRAGIRIEARRGIGEGGPGVRRVVRVDIAAGGTVKPGREAARPFPEIAEDEHGGHAALRDLGHGEIEPGEQGLVRADGGAREAGPDRMLQRGLLRTEETTYELQ